MDTTPTERFDALMKAITDHMRAMEKAHREARALAIAAALSPAPILVEVTVEVAPATETGPPDPAG